MSDDQPNQNAEQDPAGIRKALEKANAKIAELEAANAKFQRDSMFDAAGIPKDKAGKWFRKAYDGELSAEAIKAAAEADGLLEAPTHSDPPDAEVHNRIDEATAAPSPPPDDDVSAQMRKVYAEGGPDALKAFLASHDALA